MKLSDDALPDPTPPATLSSLEISSPALKAGGATAVIQALRHIADQSGLERGGQALLRLNQKGGYDCPSCAWPDPDGERSRFEFCENGAKAVASETTRRRIDRAFFQRSTVAELSQQSDYWLDQQGRLTEPMILRPGASHYEPIGWDEAFRLLAETLRSRSSPDEAIFYTSGRASNEAAFAYQLFARSFGTNNLPDCSNMCHESSGFALKQSIGVGKGTVTLDDLRAAELILIVGQNPGTNHPRMLTTLQQAKSRGASIVSINPMREAGLVAFAHPQRPLELLGAKTPLADAFVRVRANGDQALFMGIGKSLLERSKSDPDVLDTGFIANRASGFEEYSERLREVAWSEIEEGSGVPIQEIHDLANRIGKAERIISCWAMGLTQHRNAVATIQELVNLHLLRGAIGKRGAGLCPVRGHSNVQGDRTMGICERMPESFLRQLDETFGIAAPRAVGLNTLHAIRDMAENPGRVFFALGGNFLSATPDTEYTASALRHCALTTHVSTKLNRSHLITGKTGLILPCLGRSEQDMQASGPQWVTVENSMGIVHSSTGQLEPASPHLMSEVAIVCALAQATLPRNPRIDWMSWSSDYGRIRSAIEQVVPGFSDFNRRGRQPGGFYLPNAAREGRFETSTGKANFISNDLDLERVPAGKLLLMTIRSHDQFNTTIYGLDDRYRGISGERRIVFLNADDMAERGLKSQDLVDVRSYFRDEVRETRQYRAVAYDLPKGLAAMYFPEANALVPIGHCARGSETPASKSIVIDLSKSETRSGIG